MKTVIFNRAVLILFPLIIVGCNDPRRQKDSIEGRWYLAVVMSQGEPASMQMPSQLKISALSGNQFEMRGLPQGRVIFDAPEKNGNHNGTRQQILDGHWGLEFNPEEECPLRLRYNNAKWTTGDYTKAPPV